MPNTIITDISAELTSNLQERQTARVIHDGRAIAFGEAEGLVPVLAQRVESVRIEGLSYDGLRILPSGTPAAKVGEGVVKPTAVSMVDFTITLPKYAGLAEFSLERALSTTALLPALQATIGRQCLVAYDVDCVAALVADAGETATGTTWTAAILNGIAAVASNGGNPDLLVLSPADYASAVQDPGATGAFTSDPSQGITVLFGLVVAVVVGAATGTSFVMDSRAAVAVENAHSPFVLLDAVSKAEVNKARLIAELVAGFVVTQPAGVCKITVGAASSRKS